MIRAAVLAAAAAATLALAAPAAAQHAGHAAPQRPPSPPAASPAAADPHAGHAMSPVQPPQQPARIERTAPPAPPPTAGSPSLRADPHAGHDAATADPGPARLPATDPHAGHGLGTTPPQTPPAADPHAGHAMPAVQAAGAPPVAPPPPEAFSGPENAADTVYDPALSSRARQVLIDEHGDYIGWMALADRLEYRARDGRDGYAWDAQGWYGGDYNRLWLKSEGEGAFDEVLEHGEVQALYSRAVDPWFNLQAGVRQDFGEGPDRTHLVLGVQGLAPYWFEVDGALFLSTEGDLTARFEAEYDQRITNRLILQPAIEVDLAAQDVPELGVGAGLSSLEAGLRLRYEFAPEFAPYIGVEYERAFGGTAEFRRQAGDDIDEWSVLIGLRTWF